MSACSQCGESIGLLGPALYESYEYPHNPDWPIVRTDAAACCSDVCLLQYLAEKVEATR